MTAAKRVYLGYFIRGVVALVIAIVIWHLWARRAWSWHPGNVVTLAAAYAFAWVILSSPEVFVIAFILAMTIRGFCIEVYKIPTGSMEPTLHGDPIKGDQILANKFSRYLEPIRRFDVILFRYPLDKTKNFIKRVVGLPDEEFLIKDGNIYYRPNGTDSRPESNRFYLAKKSLDKQESIWIPVWLSPRTQDLSREFEKEFNISGAREWQGNKLLLQEGAGETANQSAIKGENLISYNGLTNVHYKTERGPVNYPTSEIKLAFRCQPLVNNSLPADKSAEIRIQLREKGDTFILHLKAADKRKTETAPSVESFLEHINHKNESRSQPIDYHLQSGQEYRIAVMNYDGTIYLKIDGKLILKYDYEIVMLDKDYIANNAAREVVAFGVINARAYFSDINLYGDIYYEAKGVLREGEPIKIPADRYFVIGDNVSNSKDSRLWSMKRIHLKDGQVVECDSDSYRGEEADYIVIYRNNRENKGGDIWGNEHKIKKSEIDRIEEIRYPLVRAEEIFGKALFVYWPIERIKMIK
jgi:signal peptidase I